MIRDVLKRGHHPHIPQAPALTRNFVETKWKREADKPASLPLLVEMWEHYIVDKADALTPDRGYVDKLKKISPLLSVHWLGRYQRWGHFILKKAYWQCEWHGKILTIVDEFPMLIDIVQTRDYRFMPLSDRTLPEMDMNIINIHDFLMKLRQKEYDSRVRAQASQKEELQHGRRDLINELKRLYAPLTGDTSRTIEIKPERKGNYAGEEKPESVSR